MKIGWGIDVGVASVGFAVIELDDADRPKELIDGISLVYPAPTGAAERTRYKSMRTQNKRRRDRIKALRSELVRLFDLDPDFDSENCHPDLTDGVGKNGEPRRNNSRVRLREHGLSAPLTAGDLARAIMHLAKNRGQRLTRGLKDDPRADAKQKEEERRTMADTAKETGNDLRELGRELGIDGPAHPSQLSMNRAGATEATRLKKDRVGMPVFTRGMVEAEFDALLKAQQRRHREALTDAVCKKLKEAVFKEAEPKPPAIGKCRYGERDANDDIEARLPRGADLFQRKRIFEEVNNLRLISQRTGAETPLDKGQRDCLVSRLLDGFDLTAAGARKALKLGSGALADKTSLDISGRRRGRRADGRIQGHPVAAAMRKANALEQWNDFDEEQRERISHLVRTEDDREILDKELTAIGLSGNAVRELSDIPDIHLQRTYSAAGVKATRKLLSELKKDVISNHEAEKRAGLTALDPPQPPRLNLLPYYGEVLQGWCIGGSGDPNSADEARFGRIPNPVVHVALNQLRKTANAYLRLYGKPARICIELARDLNKSAEDRERAEKEAANNRKRNDRYIEDLGAHKRKLKREDLLKIKLYRMQDGECLYTGKPICMEQLFDGSVEVDHILPRARTWDDGIANLALVFKEPNRFKARRSPFEAFFSGGYEDQDYEHILRRAGERGQSVRWRFKPDAMDRYEDRNAFQARYLNDTRYIARVASRYLQCVCADPNAVVSLNGRITSMLRHKWGLHTLISDIMIADGRLDPEDVEQERNGETHPQRKDRRKRMDKIRWDHRHHLLDAIVAACTRRSDVQRLQTLAAQETGGEDAGEICADPDFEKAGICWQKGFRKTVRAFLEEPRPGTASNRGITAVVTKADHDPRGRLHKETNYGVICEVPEKSGQYVTRKHVDIPDLDAQQIEKLGVPDTAIGHVERAVKRGDCVWWGGDDPLSALRNLVKDLAGLKADLLKMMSETPDKVLKRASTEASKKKACAQWATARYIEDKGRRRFTQVEVLSLRILKGPLYRGKKPRQANLTGGNHRLVYFIDGDGERDIEVVSTLDANTPGFRERWRREDGRALFVLRKDDLVEMAVEPQDPASRRRIYRTVSFSHAGQRPDLVFMPVEEARASKEALKRVGTRIRSIRAFRDRAPEMVRCDPAGRVRSRSPRVN